MISNRLGPPQVWEIAIGNKVDFFSQIGKPGINMVFDEVEADAAALGALHSLGKNRTVILPRDAALPAFSMKLHMPDGSVPGSLHRLSQPRHAFLRVPGIEGIEATFVSDGNNSVISRIDLPYDLDGKKGCKELGIFMFFTEPVMNGFSIAPLSINSRYGQGMPFHGHGDLAVICDYLALVWNGIQHRIADGDCLARRYRFQKENNS